jgi:Protein of unknown function (DUF2795)
MVYTKLLPRVRDLLRLSKVKPGPVTRDELIEYAAMGKFSDEVIAFLRQFPADRVFKNAAEFMTQAEELELLINEERGMPPELLRSRQD